MFYCCHRHRHRRHRLAKADGRPEVLKAPVSSSQESSSLHHHHQHPLIQCDISHSPANCAALTGSKHHTHACTRTHAHHLPRRSRSQCTVGVFRPIMPVSVFGPCGRGDTAKEGERADLLNEASWRLGAACAYECASAFVHSQELECWLGMIHPSITTYHVCLTALSQLKVSTLQPFLSHRLSDSFVCF